jgi:hypothetical protein
MLQRKKYEFCNKKNKGCDISLWCVCEAIERIEHIIEDDISDLIGEDKEFYFAKIQEKIKGLI